MTNDVTGDGTHMAGRLVGPNFIGTALSTEHGTRYSKTNFTTPMAVSMEAKRAVDLANAFVVIAKTGVPFETVVFPPAAHAGAQLPVVQELRDAVVAQGGGVVRPLTAVDVTLDWFAFRALSVSGTATAGLYGDVAAETKSLLELAEGELLTDIGAPHAAHIEQLYDVLRREAAAQAEDPFAEAIIEEDRALDALVVGQETAHFGEETRPDDSGGDGGGGRAQDEDEDEGAGVHDEPTTGATTAAPAGAPAAPPPPATVRLRRLLKAWFRRSFATRFMRFGKQNEKGVLAAISRFEFRQGQGLIGLGESLRVPGWSATPDGVAFELVQPVGATDGAPPVRVVVLDEIKTHIADAPYAAAVSAGAEFRSHMDMAVAIPVDLTSEQAARAVPSRLHLMQILAQMAVWGVPYVRYTVASARGIIYSVLLWAPQAVIDALVYVMRRLLGPVLSPFKPLYSFDETLDRPDVISTIMTSLVSAHGTLTPHELDVIASHLPRCVAFRRAVPRAAPFLTTVVPAHVCKNGIAWLYNINKGGVDRVSQFVVRVLDDLDFWPRNFTWLSKTALRRIVMLAVTAVQALRVRRAARSFLDRTASYSTFRDNLSRQGDIIDTIVDVGVALATAPQPLMGVGPAQPPPASALVPGHVRGLSSSVAVDAVLALKRTFRDVNERRSAALATPAGRGAGSAGRGAGNAGRGAGHGSQRSAASAGSAASSTGSAAASAGSAAARVGSVAAAGAASAASAEALRTAMADATPASKARLGFALLVERGLAKPGLREDDPRVVALTVARANFLVETVQELAERMRAPKVAEFEKGAFNMVRGCDLLNHDLVALERRGEGDDEDADGAGESGSAATMDTRCALCKLRTSTFTRAAGRCRVCRIALCQACVVHFHVDSLSSGSQAPRASMFD